MTTENTPQLTDFNVDELINIASCLMHDLRGNWGWEYIERMEILKEILELLIKKDPKNKKLYKEDLAVTIEEINEPYDGRVFRDGCNLYAAFNGDTYTKQTRKYLLTILTYPDSNAPEVSKFP